MPERRELAASLGARAVSPELAAVGTPNAIVLATYAPAAWELALECADRGAVIQLFAPAAPDQARAFNVNELFFKELEIQATYSAGPRDTRAALALLESGAVRADPLITHRFPLDESRRGVRDGPQPRGHQGDRHRMRAARLHAPGDLRIEEVPDPVAGPGEVVLRIGAAMTCGTDVKSVLRGHPTITSYPTPLGHEFAGTVESVGEGVASFAPGEVVFCSDSAPCGECRQCERGRESLCEDLLYVLGGFAERLLVPARVVEKNLHRLPAGVPLALAPLAEPLACAVHALDVVDVPERVTILGAGSLGLMLCALVDALGGSPVVLDPHPERLEAGARVRGFAGGAGDARRPTTWLRAGGADLVIEAVGRVESWELAVAMAAPGGIVNLFGGCARGTSFSVPTARVHYEEVTIMGTYHHAPRYIAHALEVLAAGEYPWGELVGPRISLDELPLALGGPAAFARAAEVLGAALVSMDA